MFIRRSKINHLLIYLFMKLLSSPFEFLAEKNDIQCLHIKLSTTKISEEKHFWLRIFLVISFCALKEFQSSWVLSIAFLSLTATVKISNFQPF